MFVENTPSVATIARVLRRFGLVRQRSRYRRLSIVERAPSVRAEACNDIWTFDFKGWWRARDGQRCEPLTVRDAFSRFVFASKVMESPSLEGVRAVCEALFRRYGVPLFIQVDNGTPFINVQSRGGLTRLSAWWISLGITVIRSRPGCPQDKALKGKTPAELYKPSERRPHPQHYIYPPDWVIRTVTDKGQVNMNGAQFVAGLGLARHRVALEPLGGMQYRLWFHKMDLGPVDVGMPNSVVDEVSGQFISRRRKGGRTQAA